MEPIVVHEWFPGTDAKHRKRSFMHGFLQNQFWNCPIIYRISRDDFRRVSLSFLI